MKYQKANIYHLIAVFSLFIIQFSILNSQDTWVRTYQPFGNDVSYEVEDIRICPDGGYAVIGSIWNEWEGNRGFMMKTDSDGNFMWANLDIVEFVSEPEPSGFVVLEDGSFLTAGNNFWFGGRYLLKRNSEGDIVWTQPIDYSINGIELTNDGNLITTGGSTEGDVNLQKFDLNGNLLWRGCYIPEGFEYGIGYSVTQTSDNGYAITGIVDGPNNWDVLVLKTDANGDSLWSWTFDGYGGYHDIGHSIIETDFGNLVVIGEINGPIYRSIDTFILNINAVGDTLWTEIIQDLSIGYSVINTQDGNFVGYSWSGNATDKTRLYKFDEDGYFLWNEQLAYWPAVGDRCFHVLPNEGFICCGTEMYRTSIYITKTDSMGQVTSVEDNELQTLEFKLSNYPNPFKSMTTISFSLPEERKVDITIYSIKGQKVKTLVNEDIERGIWKKVWDGSDNNDKPVSSGMYVIKLNIDEETKVVRKMIVIR